MLVQNTIHNLLKMTFAFMEIVAPNLAEQWAARLFFRPVKYKRPPRELLLIKDAHIQQIHFEGFYKRPAAESYYTLYQWGEGQPILLVHGWAGRGSQMASLAHPLVEAGYKVITFDAPAHGDSPGKETNLIEVGQVIKDIQTYSGEFRAIIGHSFGGVATAFAVNEGVKTQQIITIGSPASMDTILSGFGKQINVSEKILAKLKGYLEILVDKDIDDFSLVNLAPKINTPGLIIHDKNDKDVDYTQSLALSENWPNSQLILTEGLGHRRVLRDKETISKILSFVTKSDLQYGYQLS